MKFVQFLGYIYHFNLFCNPCPWSSLDVSEQEHSTALASGFGYGMSRNIKICKAVLILCHTLHQVSDFEIVCALCVITCPVCYYVPGLLLPVMCVTTYHVCYYLSCVLLHVMCVITCHVCYYMSCVLLHVMCVITCHVCYYLPCVL